MPVQGVLLLLAEGMGRNMIFFLKDLIKVGDRGKAHTVADGDNGTVRILQLESGLLQADVVQIIRHGAVHILLKGSAQIGAIKVKRLQNIIQTGFEENNHVKSCQKLVEPCGIIGVFLLCDFFQQTAQKGDEQCFIDALAVGACGFGKQQGILNSGFKLLNLVKGEHNYLWQGVVQVGVIKLLADKFTDFFKKFCADDDIPVLAGVSRFAGKSMDIVPVEKNDISPGQGGDRTVHIVGNFPFQNIENLIKIMGMEDVAVIIGCDFGGKRNFG